ncbi:hypothetical protein [Streptomyces pseudovenezuelae]|uniref:Lipoprotein n=1 Tax=Streptomyces pseudovenezuelae TaxID=67350 RepID=A0ABT6LV64_9ACTN|nr:hypothetical protein [Streptomyces pseudovenezuelae]MDH6220218.1 hypothetical protein [Streptomyces pseudovenezuelae]
MTRRPALLAAITLTAAAALSLSACGNDDKPAGADTDKGTPAPSTSTASDRPKIELPSDLTYTFDWPKTGDKDEDAVLADSEQSIKAVDMAIAEQDPLSKAYRYYSEGEAAAGSRKFIQEFVDYKDRITGAKHYFAAKAKVNGDGTAGLVYCEDQNKAYNRSLKTGKTDVTPASVDNYVLYTTQLRKNAKGVWVVEKLASQRGSDKCRP